MYCMITRTVCFKGYCHFLNYNRTLSCVNDKTGCHFIRVAGIVNDTAVTAKWQPSPMLYVCLCFSHGKINRHETTHGPSLLLAKPA